MIGFFLHIDILVWSCSTAVVHQLMNKCLIETFSLPELRILTHLPPNRTAAHIHQRSSMSRAPNLPYDETRLLSASCRHPSKAQIGRKMRRLLRQGLKARRLLIGLKVRRLLIGLKVCRLLIGPKVRCLLRQGLKARTSCLLYRLPSQEH